MTSDFCGQCVPGTSYSLCGQCVPGTSYSLCGQYVPALVLLGAFVKVSNKVFRQT